MRASRSVAAIFLVSLAAILLEINYTRVFSFKLYYFFTYFIIGIALLGLGAGGVVIAISNRIRGMDPVRVVKTCCLAGSTSVLVGYWIIAITPVNAVNLTLYGVELAKLTLITVALFVPFLAVGIVVATLLGAWPRAVGVLYGADLLGASLGCGLAVPLMSLLSPPSCVMLAGVALAAAAYAIAGKDTRLTEWGVLVAIYLAAALIPGAIPDVEPDPDKSIAKFARASPTGVRFRPPPPYPNGTWFSSWNPVFRIDVTRYIEKPDAVILHHDGQWGSALHRFDGDLAAISHLADDPRGLPFSLLPEEAKVLIIGSAGGHEILASLYFGAREITGVELNPVTVSLLTRPGLFAEYTGNLSQRDGVRIVNAEGRAYLKQNDDTYDLIWLVAPDSYAAMNAATSGAYVLSESYLYTVEMIRESLAHLAPGGILCAQFGEFNYESKPLRTARYLATAREALRRDGGSDFSRHVLVATSSNLLQLSTILVRSTPFETSEVDRFVRALDDVHGAKLRHAAGRPLGDDPVSSVVSLPQPELAGWLRSYPYDVSFVTDNSPFFWHFSRFSDIAAASILPQGRLIAWEDTIGEQILLLLLALASGFAAVMLLLPFAFMAPVWRTIPNRLLATIYFAALGVGFMLLEIGLIQSLTLFLGYPTYSLSVTLFSLLVFSGIGSLLSSRYRGRRNRALTILVGVLVTLIAFLEFGMPPLLERFMGVPLVWRIGLTVALMAPLGVCLGAFMPLGLSTVAALSEHSRLYVAWGWAVNGFFSVITSVLAVILAMSVGFSLLLLIAAGMYLLGVATMLRIPSPDA